MYNFKTAWFLFEQSNKIQKEGIITSDPLHVIKDLYFERTGKSTLLGYMQSGYIHREGFCWAV